MNHRLDELLLQRGRLIERIAGQRQVLRQDFVPVAAALGKVDSAVAGVHSLIETIRRHVVLTSVVVGTALIFKGKTVLRWAGRAFSAWKTWSMVLGALLGAGGHFRP